MLQSKVVGDLEEAWKAACEVPAGWTSCHAQMHVDSPNQVKENPNVSVVLVYEAAPPEMGRVGTMCDSSSAVPVYTEPDYVPQP